MTFCYVSGNYKSENVNQETFIEPCVELLPDPRPYMLLRGSLPPGNKISDSIDGNHQCEGFTGLLGESGLQITYPEIFGESNISHNLQELMISKS